MTTTTLPPASYSVKISIPHPKTPHTPRLFVRNSANPRLDCLPKTLPPANLNYRRYILPGEDQLFKRPRYPDRAKVA